MGSVVVVQGFSCPTVCGILVPGPGIEPMSPVPLFWRWILNHLTTREVPWWAHLMKGMTEDEMCGWHHRLNAHGFRWTLGVGDGRGGLACFGSWGHKELDTTEQLN